MGRSLSRKQARSSFIAAVFDHISEGQLETLEILADVEQMTQLFTSLLEVKTGQVIAMEHAFSDL